MGLKEKLINKTVFIDTAPLIYFIEGNSEFQQNLSEIFEANDKGEIQFLTSTLTLLEVLVQPLRLNRKDLVEKYERILTLSSHIEIAELNIITSRKAAELRAKYNLKTPDAIQIATAIENNITLFMTNDAALKRVAEIEILTLRDE